MYVKVNWKCKFGLGVDVDYLNFGQNWKEEIKTELNKCPQKANSWKDFQTVWSEEKSKTNQKKTNNAAEEFFEEKKQIWNGITKSVA